MRPGHILVLILLLGGTLSGFASTARAQPAAGHQSDHGVHSGTAPGSDAGNHDAQAHALFDEGRAAFAQGRFEDALRLFRQAYRLSSRPELLYNIGSAADRLRRDREALQAFQAYLDRAPPDAASRAEVQRRIEVLQAEQHRVPTSAQAARAAAGHDAAATSGAPPASGHEGNGGGLLSRWWFWTIVGVVVAGGVVAGVLIATSNGSGSAVDWSVQALGESR